MREAGMWGVPAHARPGLRREERDDWTLPKDSDPTTIRATRGVITLSLGATGA
jgi:hypothetical protein